MSFTRVLRSRGRLVVLLTWLIALLSSSVGGCSPGANAVQLSADEQAKARSSFKKRFQDYDGRKPVKKSR
jgi:hypothetical protein